MSEKEVDEVLKSINDKLIAVLEGQTSMSAVPRDLNEIKNRLNIVESNIEAIKAAIRDQTEEDRRIRNLQGASIADHDDRIFQLEHAS